MIHKDNKKQLEKLFKHFVRVQKRRVKAGKIAGGTVWNYYKAAKLFCSENYMDNEINWKRITREMPHNREYALDRIPDEGEIKKLIEYPDKRIKGIVFTMLSSGMRIGSWDYLQWKHISPIRDETNNKVVAAKIKIIDTKNDNKEYFSFITPEAYNELDNWMEYRKKHGEDVNRESYVMRNLFEATIRNGVNVGKIQNPIKLKHTGIKSLLERAAESQKLFKPLEKGKRRRDWKLAHSMRKAFKTNCELAGLNSIHIEMLMGHDIGIEASYHKPKEKELLEDYLKAIPLLTIEDANKNVDKITAEVTKKVSQELSAKYEEQNREMMKEIEESKNKIKEFEDQSIFFAFKFEMERFARSSRDITTEDIAKYGGRPKLFEWSHKQQIDYFMERMNKMGKTVSDEQIELLKQYLQKSNQPTMIWRRMTKEDEKEEEYNRYMEEEYEAETERLSKRTHEEIEAEDKRSLELHAKIQRENSNMSPEELENEQKLDDVLEKRSKNARRNR